jgi:hypothetical protein
MRSYTIRFRVGRTDGKSTEPLLDDLYDYVLDLGYDLDVRCGEFGPNWFALIVDLPEDIDPSELADDLAREFSSGFPHQSLVTAIADDAGRQLFPVPKLMFDA